MVAQAKEWSAGAAGAVIGAIGEQKTRTVVAPEHVCVMERLTRRQTLSTVSKNTPFTPKQVQLIAESYGWTPDMHPDRMRPPQGAKPAPAPAPQSVPAPRLARAIELVESLPASVLIDQFDTARAWANSLTAAGYFEVDEGELDWQDRALCAETDPDEFFPDKGGSTREAKKVCRNCEVRAECLEYALEHDERFGIWGGLSERERRRLQEGGRVMATVAVSPTAHAGILHAAAAVARHQATAGQAVCDALSFLDRFPGALAVLEAAAGQHRGISIALVLSTHCGTPAAVADVIEGAALRAVT